LISEITMNIAFLSTYPPRECGLATFTQDLVMQLGRMHPAGRSGIIAVSNESLRYDDNVIMELAQNDRSSYTQTASKLNNSDIDLLSHPEPWSFGIYVRGTGAKYLLESIDNLKIPLFVTNACIPCSPGSRIKTTVYS